MGKLLIEKESYNPDIVALSSKYQRYWGGELLLFCLTF